MRISRIRNPKSTAKLTDFGIGQVVSEEILAQVTKAGFTQTLVGPSSSSQTGTFVYMAPELLAGKPASAQADIYSLGVVFYQLVTGDLARPVTTDWSEEVKDPLLREDLKRCFAGNPTARFARAGELATNLRSLPERRAAQAEREAQDSARRETALREVLKVKRGLTLNWRQATMGAMLTVLAGWCLLISRFDFGLKALSFDLPFALRPDIRPGEVLIVYMDDESRRRLGQDLGRLWDRSLHVNLVNQLTRWKAKAIVFDILFESPWPDLKVDEQLAAAMRAHGKVVTAATVETTHPQGGPITRRGILPVEPIRSASVFGLAEFPGELDTRIRRRPQNPSWGALVELPLKTIEVLGSRPGDRTRSPWLNFYGPPGIIPSMSYFEVLETNAAQRSYISDKVVFVGQGKAITPAGVRSFDEHGTPYTRWTGLLSPGVELQATAFLNLWRGEWLTELSPFAEVIVLGFLGIVFGFGLTMFRTSVAAWIGAAGVCLIAGLALWLVWQQHLWFPWLIVCGVQIPCALGWSVLVNSKRLYAERELLRAAIPVEQARLAGSSALAEAATETAPSPSHAGAERTTADGSALTELDSAGSRAPEVTAASMAPAIPDHELIRMIGEGGYGQVWLARDVIGSYHAVKVVYRRKFSNAEPYEREFRGIQKFTPISRTHRGLIHILHVGKNDREGWFFYIIKLGDDEVSGQKINPATYSARNLAQELKKRGKLSFAESLELGLALTEALQHLHSHQLIHRDIKPSNIVFVNGQPKFADIGLVTDLHERSPATTYVGTEGYIPPEGPGTAAGDVYSLGKVLYEASMGKDRKQFPELPTSLAERADCEALLKLNEIILKACDPNVQARYPCADQMQVDLVRLQTERRGHAAK